MSDKTTTAALRPGDLIIWGYWYYGPVTVEIGRNITVDQGEDGKRKRIISSLRAVVPYTLCRQHMGPPTNLIGR